MISELGAMGELVSVHGRRGVIVLGDLSGSRIRSLGVNWLSSIFGEGGVDCSLFDLSDLSDLSRAVRLGVLRRMSKGSLAELSDLSDLSEAVCLGVLGSVIGSSLDESDLRDFSEAVCLGVLGSVVGSSLGESDLRDQCELFNLSETVSLGVLRCRDLIGLSEGVSLGVLISVSESSIGVVSFNDTNLVVLNSVSESSIGVSSFGNLCDLIESVSLGVLGSMSVGGMEVGSMSMGNVSEDSIVVSGFKDPYVRPVSTSISSVGVSSICVTNDRDARYMTNLTEDRACCRVPQQV